MRHFELEATTPWTPFLFTLYINTNCLHFVEECCMMHFVEERCMMHFVEECCMMHSVEKCCMMHFVEECCMIHFVEECCMIHFLLRSFRACVAFYSAWCRGLVSTFS